jgi:hypothetical protein
MKTKLLLSFLLITSYCLLCTAQVPQGLNYQALALDGSGDPIKKNNSLQVKIGILSDTITPVVVWEELHNPVKTNAYGVFNLVIGTGVRQSGSALTFTDIDWTATPLFLKIQIYYQSTWKYMGSAQLWSVPYSMIAGDLEGAVKKIAVVGDNVESDEALFEVKRKDGETMFAVYNHGVRVFMPLDTLSKGKKGGFAIGGFSKAKGTIQDYFVVNPDSIRAYIDTNPAKGTKGGFAIGGFSKAKSGNEEYLRVTRDSTRIYLNDTGAKARKGGFAIGGFDKSKSNIQDFLTVSSDSIRLFIDTTLTKSRKGGFAIGGFNKAKGSNASFFNVSPDPTGTVKPSQNRILWYPLKNAFLTGRVLAESKDSVGENSFASGFESKAKGMYSQALGYKAIARGDYSTAIGKNALANNINSFAFGDSSRAVNLESYAFGRGAIASGYRSFAFGSAGVDIDGKVTNVAKSLGNYSFAIGQGSLSMGLGSFAIGLADTARGNYSLAMGYKTNATGRYSTAMGDLTKALGEVSTAMGIMTTASADFSTAIGSYTNASGYGSTAIGYFVTASGNGSTAMGCNTTAFGHYSAAFGFNTKAKPWVSFVIGRWNDTTCIWSTNWNDADPLFIIGNGSSNTSRKNAMTVLKNGNVGIGVSSPSAKLHIKGSTPTDAVVFLQPSVWNSTGDYGELRFGDVNHYIRGEYGNGMTFHDPDKFQFEGSNVGIGTSAPAFPLDVASSVSSYQVYGYFNSGGACGTGSGTWNYSIRAVGRILADEFNAVSDARIKNIIGTSIKQSDLEVLNKLQVKDFQFIDKPIKGDKIKKGFVAQEVEQVFPEAVSYCRSFIPDIYRIAQNLLFDKENKTLTISLDTVIQLNIGDKIKLYSEIESFEKPVVKVISSKNFVIGDWNKDVNQLFVYGREINDFRSIDYDRIFTLGISSIQELSHQNDAMHEDIASLKNENQQLRSELDELKVLVNSLIANHNGQGNK